MGSSFVLPFNAFIIPIMVRTVIRSPMIGAIIQPIIGIAATIEKIIALMKRTKPWLV